jgi:hypothetical protein
MSSPVPFTHPTPSQRPRLWRQGDILIEECAALPEGCEPVRTRVIAKGEVTGHAHRLKAPRSAATLFQPPWRSSSPRRPGLLGLRVTGKGCVIAHPEHAPIPLDPGQYVLWRQQEFDHLGGGMRPAGD